MNLQRLTKSSFSSQFPRYLLFFPVNNTHHKMALEQLLLHKKQRFPLCWSFLLLASRQPQSQAAISSRNLKPQSQAAILNLMPSRPGTSMSSPGFSRNSIWRLSGHLRNRTKIGYNTMVKSVIEGHKYGCLYHVIISTINDSLRFPNYSIIHFKKRYKVFCVLICLSRF